MGNQYIYGPREVAVNFTNSELKAALVAAALFVRELCLFDLENSDKAYFPPSHDLDQDRIELLAGPFYFHNTSAICEFLKQHKILVPVLFEVRKKVDQYFGSDVEANLELVSDPEDSHSTPKLFALILTTLSSEEASTRLDQLDREWWLNQSREVRRVLSIDVDYLNDGIQLD